MFSYNDINLVATSRPTSFFKGDVTERLATTIFSPTQRWNEHRCDIVPALQRCVALKIVMGIVPCNITLRSGASYRPRNGQARDEVARGRPSSSHIESDEGLFWKSTFQWSLVFGCTAKMCNVLCVKLKTHSVSDASRTGVQLTKLTLIPNLCCTFTCNSLAYVACCTCICNVQ